MNPTYVFFALLGPVFALGWWLGGLYEKRKRMYAQPPIDRLFGWFAHGNRLVGLVVCSMVFAVVAGLYTFQADVDGESRDEKFVNCLTAYIDDLGQQAKPRSLAFQEMTDAQRDWNRGHSDKYPQMNADELKARYLALYDAYAKVTKDNPPPQPINKYCKEFK